MQMLGRLSNLLKRHSESNYCASGLVQGHTPDDALRPFCVSHQGGQVSATDLVNYAEVIGMTLFLGGLVGFFTGAFQVYRAKLRRIGMVEGGVYRYIRHPQYAALIIASLGLLLIWPRFLVLFSPVAMISPT